MMPRKLACFEVLISGSYGVLSEDGSNLRHKTEACLE